MASDKVTHFTDANFEQEVLNSTKPVLVDFWAEWCPPCVALGPTIDKLANEYVDRVKVGKLDIDSNSVTAAKYSISAIPTVLVFKGGQMVQKFQGLPPEKKLQDALKSVI